MLQLLGHFGSCTLADALRPVYHPGETWMKNLQPAEQSQAGRGGVLENVNQKRCTDDE